MGAQQTSVLHASLTELCAQVSQTCSQWYRTLSIFTKDSSFDSAAAVLHATEKPQPHVDW
jgi:hypothetical protein